MQGFPNSGKGWGGGKFFPVEGGGGSEILLGGGGDFLWGEGNLRRRDFDDSKQLPVNTEHQLKSKLT